MWFFYCCEAEDLAEHVCLGIFKFNLLNCMPARRFKVKQVITYILNMNHPSRLQLLMYFLNFKSLVKVGNLYFSLKFNTNSAYFFVLTGGDDWPLPLFVCRINLVTVVDVF